MTILQWVLVAGGIAVYLLIGFYISASLWWAFIHPHAKGWYRKHFLPTFWFLFNMVFWPWIAAVNIWAVIVWGWDKVKEKVQNGRRNQS